MSKLASTLACATAICAMACGNGPAESELGSHAQPLSNKDFDVTFGECTEYVGIAPVPEANALALLPAEYQLASGGPGQAILVVRVVDCAAVAVDGKKPKAAKLSQIGLTITGGDPTADINNYTLWYATDLGVLHGKLNAAGVATEVDQLTFTFNDTGTGSGPIQIDVTPPQAPDFQATGTGIVPTSGPVPFVASWWAEGKRGTVLMRTDFPTIRFSGATVTLTTPSGSELAALIGGTSLVFPFLDSYNSFDTADMAVTNED